MTDFEYLLSSIDNIKGVGKKTLTLLIKKKYLQFLIYFGNYHYQKLKQQKILKLKIFKLVKRIISN